MPRADKTWEYTIDNKNYTISLKNGEVTVDEAVADSSVANLKISKQKSLRRINYTDTDSQSDWEIVVWEKESVTVDQVYVDTYAPRNSRGEKGNVHSTSEEQEPVYTPVDASDKKVTGFNNSNSSLDMEQSRHFCYKRNHT